MAASICTSGVEIYNDIGTSSHIGTLGTTSFLYSRLVLIRTVKMVDQ